MGKRIGKSLKSDQKFHNFSLTKRSKTDPKLVTECKMRTWIKPSPSWTSKEPNFKMNIYSLTYDVKSPNTLKYTTLHEFQILKVSSSLLSLIVHSIKINSIE